MRPILTQRLFLQRLKIVLPFIQGSVLDLGCGGAYILDHLDPSHAYTGVEAHLLIYEWLLENRPGYVFHHLDIEQDDFELPTKFDTILMLAVLEHLRYPERAIAAARRQLEPWGRLLITTPTSIGLHLHTIGSKIGLTSAIASDEHIDAHNYTQLEKLLTDQGMMIDHYQKFLLGGNQFIAGSAEQSGN